MTFALETKNNAASVQPSLQQLERAAALVYRSMPPTPQYRWPLLEARVGTTVWVKHENHTPTGAFKVRGGLVYLDELCRAEGKPNGVISATRGKVSCRAGIHDAPGLDPSGPGDLLLPGYRRRIVRSMTPELTCSRSSSHST